MTAWADIITNAMIYIDDIRIKESLEENPALFFRRMSAYVENALPMMSRPPELLSYLQTDMVKPEYEDYSWKPVIGDREIDTGITGYELVSITVQYEDGTTYEALTDFTYDEKTGKIVLDSPAKKEEESYDIDFYKDGSFQDLTPSMTRLFSLAIAIVWDERFSRNWLNLQPKIKDASFETINEANYMDKVTVRMKENRASFNDELRKYEQDNAYMRHASIKPGTNHLI